MRALARFAQLRPSGDPECALDEFAADEVDPALHLSRSAAAVRLDTAIALTSRLPATLVALERGLIDMIKARAVVEATDPLTVEQAAQVQAEPESAATTGEGLVELHEPLEHPLPIRR